MYVTGSPARWFSKTRQLLLTAGLMALLAPGGGSVAAQGPLVPTDIGHLGGGSAQATAAADGYVVGRQFLDKLRRDARFRLVGRYEHDG